MHQVGVSTEAIYGSMEQATRSGNLSRFRSRKCRVLVVTDVAARGIDIPLLDNVVNFDFPDKPKLFVHRHVCALWCPSFLQQCLLSRRVLA